MYDSNVKHIFFEDAGDMLVDMSIASGELGNIEDEVDLYIDQDDIIEAPSDFSREDLSNPEDSVVIDPKQSIRDEIVRKAIERQALLDDRFTLPTVTMTVEPDEPTDSIDSDLDSAEDLDDLLEMTWASGQSNTFWEA